MKRIVLVEDNPDNRLLVQAILEDVYEIIEYENGVEALEGLKQDTPDLVLLDISLPEMDGMEVAGFDDYITKPILDEDILLNAIEKGLKSKTE